MSVEAKGVEPVGDAGHRYVLATDGVALRLGDDGRWWGLRCTCAGPKAGAIGWPAARDLKDHAPTLA